MPPSTSNSHAGLRRSIISRNRRVHAEGGEGGGVRRGGGGGGGRPRGQPPRLRRGGGRGGGGGWWGGCGTGPCPPCRVAAGRACAARQRGGGCPTPRRPAKRVA